MFQDLYKKICYVSVGAVAIVIVAFPFLTSADVVGSYGGPPASDTTFVSPTHGQALQAGGSVYVSGKTTIQFCTSYMYVGYNRYGSPNGCKDKTVFDDVTECGVTYSFRSVGSTSGADSHMGTYLGNFSKNEASATCRFDNVIPVPNVSPGDYILWEYVIWGQKSTDPIWGAVEGINFGSWCEHVTISDTPIVDNNPALVFTADPHTVVLGAQTRLRWQTYNIDSCTASDGWSGTKRIGNRYEDVAVSAPTTFSLNCTGPNGSITRSVFVDTALAVTGVDIKANDSNGPITVENGSNLKISWTSQNAQYCYVDGLGDHQRISGNYNTTANNTMTYWLICRGVMDGVGGVVNAQSDRVLVNVLPPKPNLISATAPTFSGSPMVNRATTLTGVVTNNSPTGVVQS